MKHRQSGKSLYEKLRGQRGESIAEALAAMLLLTLSTVMLAGAVVTSARITSGFGNSDALATVEATEEARLTKLRMTYRLGELHLSKTVEIRLTEAGGMEYDRAGD